MKKTLTAIAVLAFALVLFWRPWEEKPVALASKSHPASAPRIAIPEPAQEILQTPDTPKAPISTPDIPPAGSQRVLDAIDNLEFSFRDFATALGGNPVGTNVEITAALLGDNAKQLRLAIPEGSTVNSQGELCDPWGTPWFFHQLSGTKMEIRSAGPDRILYNADDFVR